MQALPARPWLNRAVVIFATTVVVALILSLFSTVMMVRFAKTNRTSNLVNCRLLTNAIIESGASGNVGDTRPQQQLNQLYVTVINRLMTPTEKQLQTRLLTSIGKAGALVTVPDCEDVVKHPEKVKDIHLTVTQPKETP